MSARGYTHGITDNPPTTLSGRQLFAEWLTLGHVKSAHSNAPYEYKATDDSFVLWKGTLDFDYHMAYLLEIRSGPGGNVSDHIFCYQKHAGTSEIAVEWDNHPRHLGDDGHAEAEEDTVGRWVTWVYDTFRKA